MVCFPISVYVFAKILHKMTCIYYRPHKNQTWFCVFASTTSSGGPTDLFGKFPTVSHDGFFGVILSFSLFQNKCHMSLYIHWWIQWLNFRADVQGSNDGLLYLCWNSTCYPSEGRGGPLLWQTIRNCSVSAFFIWHYNLVKVMH